MNLLLPVSLCSSSNPLECRTAKHELFASNGCYTWDISHPHMISMTPGKVRGDCVDSVILEPLLNRESKTLIWITAKDKNSGQILESQAQIAMLNRLAININYRHLYINDKKHIDVVAYDDQGNIFSGLDGFRFDWTIITGQEHLKIIQKPEGYLHKRSADGTDVQYVKGLTAGQSDLKVRILEPGYENINSVEVTILVVSPFVVEPQREIYLLPTSQFNYNLVRLKKQDNGDVLREKIQTPDVQYQWSVATDAVGKINQEGHFVSGPNEGTQTILVVDKKMVNNTAEAQLQVVDPYKLQMSIHDVTSQSGKAIDSEEMAETFGIKVDQASQSHILVENRLYLVLLSLQDKDGNRITLTDNLLMESQSLLDQPWIEKVKVNKIGSQILFKTRQIDAPIKKMQTSYALKEIRSMFAGHVHVLNNKAKLTVDAELVLTKPVSITHPTDLILLPYLHNQGQIWSTSAVGGSGVYTWSVEDPDIVSVQGSVTVKSLKVGKTRLIVQDHRNFQNMASIEVEVAQLNQLKWLEEQMELRAGNSSSSLGEVATLNVIALDRQGRKFTNCTSVSLQYVTKGEGNVLVLPQTSTLQYTSLQAYVQGETTQDLISLRQRFDENPSKVYLSDLPQVNSQDKSLLTYNNFGICQQAQISAVVEGLGRVRAQYIPLDADEMKVVESEFAEIAVYKKLESSAPDVSSFFDDLYSKTQIGQEFQTLDHLYVSDVLTLTSGTSITWSVLGGTNFWQDYSDSYNVEWNVTPVEGTKNCLQIVKEKEKTTKFDIRIHCQATTDLTQINKLKVTMNQNSKQSRQLLKPAQHSVSINVECGAPKSSRLLWSQAFSEIAQNLPSSRIQQNERIHFALAGSKHFVKTVLMDADHIAYLNISSVIAQVTSSDAQLATVSLPEPSFESALQTNRYAKRQIQFSNSTGTVTIKSESNSYLNFMLPKESRTSYTYSVSSAPKDTSDWNLGELSALPKSLTDTLKVQVIKKLQVEPKFKSMYLGSANTFKLTILEGSGHFTVSQNNTEIAELVHKDREIFITPKGTGMLEISVEDIELPGSEVSKAHILVSDIDKLYLWSPRSLIEQGDEMNLIVSALDSQGNDFDEDQYTNMRFSIETEMTGVISRKHGLKTETTSLNTEFKAHGKEPGIYQLTAFTRRTSQTEGLSMNIVSDMIRVEVFPLLEIFPTELLITPNMKYTLQIVGGPQTSVQSFQNGSSIEINFDIVESDVAIVDTNREVTGLKVGDATLRYQIIQQRTQKVHTPRGIKLNELQVDSRVVSKHFVPIRVRLVTDIEIPLADHRQIYSGSLVKFNAVLKHGHEYFNHGVAPISYNWNSTSGRILNLELPSESLMTASGYIQKSRRLRNNERKDDNALFATNFNSSSIYATAGKEGDAQVNVLLAIEYPQAYQVEKNWFSFSATVKVASQLNIQVNKFSSESSLGTHMYLIPPNTIGHIHTNIDTKLKLGYSTVSVYDHSTNSFRSEEATNPIVKLIDNKAIQTFDKYGKVTVVVEQGGQSFSDQVAMLNVFIADIYSIQVMNTYESLNLPLGSSYQLPIHFQNEHANRFADNVEGIRIGYSLSHPKVVQVQLDALTQTLTILSQGSGDCNILIYLESNPQIFDVIKVKVSSIVRPLSPVYLHIGGEVEFRVINPDDQSKSAALEDHHSGASWKSSEPAILQIGSSNGKATGQGEGRAEIMLSNHINAASIVHVGRIQFGQIEQKNALVLNTDETSVSGNRYIAPDDLRVRVKLYLTKNGEEVMPTTQYDGVTLIRQNVGITCASDQPDFVEATGVVSDLEGFFCVLKYKQDANHKSMPRFVKVSVNAYAMRPNSTTPLYSDQIAQFEVQLLSSIKVEKKFKNGIALSRERRQEAIQIFSSSDFNVKIEYQDVDTANEEEVYLKHKWTRQDNSNDYNLTVIVPSEVTKDFKANIVLTHPYTKFQRVLPVTFTYRAAQSVSQPPKQATVSTTQKTVDPEYEGMRSSQPDSTQGGTSWSSYIAVFIVAIASVIFVLYNWTNVNVFGLQGRGNNNDGNQQRPSRNRPMEMNYAQGGIREPTNRSFPRKNYNYATQSSIPQSAFSSVNQSQSAFDQRRVRQAPLQGGMNLDRFDGGQRGLDRSGGDPSRVSLYSNSLDNSRY